MATDLLSEVLNTFKTHGNAPDLRAEVIVLPCEAFITILAPQPTAAMHQLACLIESEFDELGHRVSIEVRRPASGLWGWLVRSGHRMLGMG